MMETYEVTFIKNFTYIVDAEDGDEAFDKALTHHRREMSRMGVPFDYDDYEID